MILVTWNVAGRVRRRAEQGAAVAELGADVICLQEVSRNTLAPWRAELEGLGYDVLASLDGLAAPPERRPKGVLVAARQPLARVPSPALPWPERHLAAQVSEPPVCEVHNLHSPISPAPGLAKVLTHEAMYQHLASAGSPPRILCGDLNTPRRESAGGELMTFARSSSGKLRPERGERWDRAELALVGGLAEHGWRDAFRSLHGYHRREVSWAWPSGGGYRLDHVLVSPGVEVVRCEYIHAWRQSGLSDHSGLLAELRIAAQ